MQRSFTAAADAPREARRFVGGLLTEARAPDSVIDDLRLAVSELVSNAVEHGGPGAVVVSLTCSADIWTLEVVAPVSAATPSIDAVPRPADPDRPRGRGLGIVAAVSDGVDVEHRDGSLVVRCRRRVS